MTVAVSGTVLIMLQVLTHFDFTTSLKRDTVIIPILQMRN